MFAWLRMYATTFWWMGAFSLIMFIGTLIAIPILVARIPADYFTRSDRAGGREQTKHPVLRLLGRLFKNVLGFVFIVAGLVMLVLPGQGIITILVGITLMEFPGKRAVERRIVAQPTVLRMINWMRARAQQSELIMTESVSGCWNRNRDRRAEEEKKTHGNS